VIWFFSDPLRSKQEREALEDLVSRVDWIVPGEWRIDASLRLIWDADLVVNDRTFPVSLRYPNHFPHSPSLVLPRGEAERWSTHQYGAGGELCLEFGPDNWRPDITGAQMIESAYRLLSGERPSLHEAGEVAMRPESSCRTIAGRADHVLARESLRRFRTSAFCHEILHPITLD
jgi:sulfur-carrier protein adenylyltransferase/sulfurtransferase